MKTYYFIFIVLFSLINPVQSQTPVYYQGFPVIVDTLRKQFQKAGGPLITDLENDGQKEIIFFCVDYNGAVSPGVMLYVIKSDGSNYPNFPKGYNELILDKVSGDVNGDGYLDIVMRMTNTVDVIDRFGNHLPGFPVNYSDGDVGPFKPVNIYDLDNDGLLEIIVCKNNESVVFNSNGTIRNGWPQNYSGICRTNAAIGDIDNDGMAEIVVPVYTSDPVPVFRIFRQNGELFSQNWNFTYDSSFTNWGASPTLILNRNNSDSTYIIMSSKRLGSGGISRNRLTKYNILGEIVDQGYNNVLNGLGTLVIGDVDRDGKPEFTNSAQGSPYLTLYSNNLIKLPGWPNEGVGEHYATPTIGRLSFSNDLIVADNNWDAFDPIGFGNIFAYNKDGSPLPWSPLRPIGLVNSISLADLNNDGSVEIIAISSKTGSETYLHIWTVPGIPYTNETFPWPQNGHDRYKSNQYGFIPPDEPVGIQPYSTEVPDRFSLSQNYPNPFNPVTTIKFEIRTSSNVKFTIFDALGRQLESLVNERLTTGTHSLTFDGSSFSSGVYFYKLDAGEFSETKRMILLK
ncbi:MAG: T9SS type A sorting domain-containing protein [Ignavibacteria bacterium]|nr:T9SS type A sorting domain-containing protein [Ignavibacteria bacterium]